MNWPQNDYWLGPLLGPDVSRQQAETHISRAKQLSLSLLYWLQTECPRADGKTGWKGLRLRPDLVGTEDGLAKAPYIRESRRIQAEFTVVEQHVGTEARRRQTHQQNVVAETFLDSVGVGSYRIDLHPSTGGFNYIDISSLPFQVPLGALIPRRIKNLLPACKNLGTTHITNGCFRLHPVEWAIGEAAGALVAFCLESRLGPSAVRNTPGSPCGLSVTLDPAGSRTRLAEGAAELEFLPGNTSALMHRMNSGGFLLSNRAGKRTIRKARQRPGIRTRVDSSRSAERIIKVCSASEPSHVRARIAANRGDTRVATSNPAFSQDIFAGYGQVYGVPRSTVTTVQGTMSKTFLLLAIMSGTALWAFHAVGANQLQLGVIPVAGIAGFILAMVTIFKPTIAPWTSPVYAAMEGVFLGAISQIVEMQYHLRYPGIALQAVMLTSGTLLLMIFLYANRIIRVTDRLRSGVIMATGALCLFYFVSMILGFFGVAVPFVFSSGPYRHRLQPVRRRPGGV